MASASFRDQMNALGWSRRGQDEPINTSQQTGLLSSFKSLNPFGDRGYVRLPTTEGAGAPLPAPSRREEEEGWLACESFLVTQTSFPQSVSVALAECQPTVAALQRALRDSARFMPGHERAVPAVLSRVGSGGCSSASTPVWEGG